MVNESSGINVKSVAMCLSNSDKEVKNRPELSSTFDDIARDLKTFYLSPKADISNSTYKEYRRIKDKWLKVLALIPDEGENTLQRRIKESCIASSVVDGLVEQTRKDERKRIAGWLTRKVYADGLLIPHSLIQDLKEGK